MQQYDNIIWDWNGTLLDDVELSLQVANGILDDHELPRLVPEVYREIFDFPVITYWEKAGMDFSVVDFAQLSERFCGEFEQRLHEAPLFEETIRVLHHFSEPSVSLSCQPLSMRRWAGCFHPRAWKISSKVYLATLMCWPAARWRLANC